MPFPCCGPNPDSSCVCGPTPCCAAPRPAFVTDSAAMFGSYNVDVVGLFGATANGSGGGVINSTLSGLPCRNRVTGSPTNVGTVTSSDPCSLVGSVFMRGLWQISGSTVRLEVSMNYAGGSAPNGAVCFSGTDASGVVILNNDGSVSASSCSDSGGSCTVSANMGQITVVRSIATSSTTGTVTASVNVLGVFPCSGIDPGPFPDIFPSCVEPLALPDRTLHVPRRLISIPTPAEVRAVARGGRVGGCSSCNQQEGLE